MASTASGRQIRSSSAKSSRFGSSSSTIASITTSQSAKSPSSVVSESRLDGGIARGLLELSLLDLAREEVRRSGRAPARPARRVTSRPTVSIAGLDAELRDPGAHRTEPDDADLADLHGARFYLCVSGGIAAYHALVSISHELTVPRHDAVEPALVLSVTARPAIAARAASNCSAQADVRVPPERAREDADLLGRDRPVEVVERERAGGCRTTSASARAPGPPPGRDVTSTTAKTACQTLA